MSTDSGQLELRHDQTTWEAEMWARELIRLVLYGTPPSLPIALPVGAEDMVREVLAEMLADEIHPETA